MLYIVAKKKIIPVFLDLTKEIATHHQIESDENVDDHPTDIQNTDFFPGYSWLNKIPQRIELDIIAEIQK